MNQQIQQFAKGLMDEAQRDLHAALTLGLSRIVADVALQRMFAEFGLDVAVRQQWRSGHAEYWHGDRGPDNESLPVVVETEPAFGGGLKPVTVPPLPDAGLVATARVQTAAKRFMDYEMPDGVRLGDCTRTQVERYATLVLKQSRTMAKVGSWLDAVAGLIPKRTDHVRDVLRDRIPNGTRYLSGWCERQNEGHPEWLGHITVGVLEGTTIRTMRGDQAEAFRAQIAATRHGHFESFTPDKALPPLSEDAQ